MSPRYAIYFTPAPDAPVWRFGSEVIGYDAASGLTVEPPGGAPFDRPDWAALTEDPRRYGFHATLKAPFHLAHGQDEETLLAAADRFAAAWSGFVVPRLAVETIGRFVALVPAAPSKALATLAEECVRTFEPFRAPLTEADRRRRLASPLSDRQRAQLESWGYPYVLDDFRFHMTLTGPLPPACAEEVRAALAQRYTSIDPGLPVDAVTIARQPDRASRFRILARLPFGQPDPAVRGEAAVRLTSR